jgi:predicted O-methyltransferase YrrM
MMADDDIHHRLAHLAGDAVLDLPEQWRARAEALEWMENGWPQLAGNPAAQALRTRLEQVDARLHRRLRAAIRAGHGQALFGHWRRERGTQSGAVDGEGYDALDELVAGVLRLSDPGAELLPLAPEMVFYQPTPARHVLDMLARTAPGPQDVLVDLGSGLGHVPMLAALCTGAQALGVEWQPAYVACAQRAARALGLHGVRFVAGDARDADLSGGTLFFLYTPFGGTVLRQVLDALRTQAARRPIRLCTFGPCSRIVAGETWLRADGPPAPDRAVVFEAVP